jgi:hypothetical protein
MSLARRVLVALASVVAVAGCGDEPVDETLGGSQQIFTDRCTEGCHSGERPNAGLSLSKGEARAQLVDVPTMKLCPGGVRLIPGDPDASCVWQLVRDDVMPFFEEPLDQASKDVLLRWIEDGAPE